MRFGDFKQNLLEGVYDPGIFKAFFLAGGLVLVNHIQQKKQRVLLLVNLNGVRQRVR